MSHLQTSTLPFKQRVEQQVHNEIMRKAVVKAQETIGANRQKMVDELGNWEEWRDLSKQFRKTGKSGEIFQNNSVTTF